MCWRSWSCANQYRASMFIGRADRRARQRRSREPTEPGGRRSRTSRPVNVSRYSAAGRPAMERCSIASNRTRISNPSRTRNTFIRERCTIECSVAHPAASSTAHNNRRIGTSKSFTVSRPGQATSRSCSSRHTPRALKSTGFVVMLRCHAGRRGAGRAAASGVRVDACGLVAHAARSRPDAKRRIRRVRQGTRPPGVTQPASPSHPNRDRNLAALPCRGLVGAGRRQRQPVLCS